MSLGWTGLVVLKPGKQDMLKTGLVVLKPGKHDMACC